MAQPRFVEKARQVVTLVAHWKTDLAAIGEEAGEGLAIAVVPAPREVLFRWFEWKQRRAHNCYRDSAR
jgi:hypothetical protein